MAVKIYTTTSCPYCRMAKEFFKQKNVSFEEINVEENPDAAKEMVEKSGQTGVPVIEINGQVVVGFDRPAIEDALER